MSQMKVSVIIPVYNAEAFLNECLDSLIHQTLKEFEIICVDDGSTDGSLSILKDYEKKDPRVQVYTQENKFAGVARNHGYEHATGKYVLFLDADDFFELNMLEEAWQFAEEKQADICVFNSNRFDVTKQVFQESNGAFRKDLFDPGTVFSPKEAPYNENLFRMFFGWAWDKLIRRGFIEKTGLRFQSLRSTNDMFFSFMSLALAERIVCLDKVLAHQRVNVSTSISRTREKSWDNFYLALIAMRDELKKRGLYDCYRRAFLNWCANFTLWQIKTMPGKAFVKAYTLMHESGIRELEILDLEETLFFSPAEYHQIRKIADEPLLPFPMDSKGVSKTGNEPLVSIVMPSLNVGGYMEQCLKSVVNEDLKDIEIICVDAGSTDGTIDVIERFAKEDSRIQLIHSDQKSYGYQMNLGLKAAKGEYFAIVETDDFISPAMHSELYQVAKKYDLDLVKANHFHLSQVRDTFSEAFAEYPYHSVFSLEERPDFARSLAGIWNGLYRRSFLLENKIDFLETPGASYQDTAFVAKTMCAAKRMMLVKKPYYHYRMDNSNSSVKSVGKVYSVCEEFADVENYLAERETTSLTVRKAMAGRKLDVYHWNYKRISDGFKLDFLWHIYPELKKNKKDGLLEEELLLPESRDFAAGVIKSPEAYYYKEKRNFIPDTKLIEETLESREKCENPEFTFLIDPEEADADALAVCLESVLKQTQLEIEVYLLFSEDRPDAAFVRRIAEKDRRVTILDADGTQTDQLKHTLSDMRGTYLYVLSGRDFLRRDFCDMVLKQIKKAEKNREEEPAERCLYLLDGFKYNLKNGAIQNGKYLTKKYYPELPYFTGETIEPGSRFLLANTEVPAFLIRRADCDAVLEDLGEAQLGCRDLSVLFLACAKAFCVLKNKVFFHPAPKELTDENAKKLVRDLDRICAHLSGKKLFEELKTDFSNYVVNEVAKLLKQSGNLAWKKEALRMFAASDAYQNAVAECTDVNDYLSKGTYRKLLVHMQVVTQDAPASADETYRVRKAGSASEQPAVSVIIPVYNAEEYVGECLDSITGQTLKDLEIICVNDGSTDSSLTVLLEYAEKDDRITVLDQKNGGTSKARNSGLSEAKGTYIYFMDADDCLDTNALALLLKDIKERELDLLFFEAELLIDPDNALKNHRLMHPKNYLCSHRYDEICTGMEYMVLRRKHGEYTVQPCLMLIRHAFLDSFGFGFKEGCFYEDNISTFTLLMHAQKVGHMHQPFFKRRMVATSKVMQSTTWKQINGYFLCYLEMRDLIIRNDRLNEEQRSVAWDIAMEMVDNTIIKYKAAPLKEREFYHSYPEEMFYLFRSLVVRPVEAEDRYKKLEAKYSERKEELKEEQAARQKAEKNAAALKKELKSKKKEQSGINRLFKPLKRIVK